MAQSIHFRFGNHTDIGRVRSQNEDYMGFFENANGSFFVVCDGMGGHVGGAVASQTAVNTIRQFFESQFYPHLGDALYQALQYANQQIYQTAQARPSLLGMGTTCVVLCFRDGLAYTAHVGDSRIYLYRGGLLKRLTRDHSFVQALIDQGVINESEAESHPRRNELLRALGTEPFVDVEVIREPLQPEAGDLFLLCSDGLNSLVSDRGIEEILAEPEELQAKAIQLVNLANTLGGHDNITVQLVEVLTPGHSRTFSQSFGQNLDSPASSNLSYTQPQSNFDPPLSYEKKKEPLDIWPEEEQENRPKKRGERIEISDSGLPDLKPSLLRGFVILVALVFLYVIFQNTLGKSAYIGSSGSLAQDSARAIALQTWFYDYTGIQKAKNTYQKAKQTITDLNELKKRKLRALDSLFRNKRVRKIANRIEENGESVEDLALRYRSKVDWILKANGVEDAAALQNLDSLAIPLEAPQSPLP